VRTDEYNIPADACANPMHGLIAGPPNRWPAGPSHPIRRPDVASFIGRALLYYLFAARSRTPRVR